MLPGNGWRWLDPDYDLHGCSDPATGRNRRPLELGRHGEPRQRGTDFSGQYSWVKKKNSLSFSVLNLPGMYTGPPTL